MNKMTVFFLFIILSSQSNAVVVNNESAHLLMQPNNPVVGQEVILTLEVADIPAVYGIQFEATFNPTILKLIPEKNGETNITPGSFYNGEKLFSIKNTVNAREGEIIFINSLLRPAKPLSGSGALFTLRFMAIAEGNPNIAVKTLKLGSDIGTVIAPKLVLSVADSVSLVSSSVNNNTDFQPNLKWFAVGGAGGLLLLAGLLIFFRKTGRSKRSVSTNENQEIARSSTRLYCQSVD